MGSVNQPPITKSAFWTPKALPYITTHLSDSHDQVLYRLGEYAIFVMMWRALDFEAGLVGRCPTCYLSNGRIAAAYKQAPDPMCPDCFGTTFEGGYRARVIRPAVISDLNTDTTNTARGEIVTDSVAIETTSDVFLRRNDYCFRADGSRYQTQEMNTLVVRTGFDVPERDESVGGVIPGATLEDPSSVAYLIPPENDVAHDLLHSLTIGRHIPADLRSLDEIRPNGYLVP